MIAFDTETGLISFGRATPPLACVSFCRPGQQPQLLSASDGIDAFAHWLRDGETLVTANGVYDCGVIVAERPELLRAVFEAYRDGRVRCVQNRQKLLDIADGKFRYVEDGEGGVQKSEYSLAALAQRHLGLTLEKGGRFDLEYKDFAHLPPEQWYARAVELAEASDQFIRFRYARLVGVPLADWPEDARAYALKDAELTLQVYQAQPSEVVNELEVTREHWALFLMRVWGLRTNGQKVAQLRAALETEASGYRAALEPTGFIRGPGQVNPKSKTGRGYPQSQWGTRNMAAIKERIVKVFEGRKVPRTDAGDVSTDADTKLLSGDPDLTTLGKLEKLEKVLSSFVPVLELGTRAPICADWNPIVETLRTSCRKPALQTPPRKGGVRECFEPRPGMVYLSADYDTAELRSLAAKLEELGFRSVLAETLRAGKDPHLMYAAALRGRTYEETRALYEADDPQTIDDRQLAKIPNFGKPGGMSFKTLVGYARGNGVNLCEARKVRTQCRGQDCGATGQGEPDFENPGCLTVALELDRVYLGLFTEMPSYFAWVKSQLNRREKAQFYDPVTRHTRVAGFCDACNGFFQTRTARGARAALWRVSWECYLESESPLYGSRPVLFFHDEIMPETPEPLLPGAGARLEQVMVEEMQPFVPGIPVKAGPKASRYWAKKAKAVYDAAGRLQVWA